MPTLDMTAATEAEHRARFEELRTNIIAALDRAGEDPSKIMCLQFNLMAEGWKAPYEILHGNLFFVGAVLASNLSDLDDRAHTEFKAGFESYTTFEKRRIMSESINKALGIFKA
jgi:hypothetical protein